MTGSAWASWSRPGEARSGGRWFEASTPRERLRIGLDHRLRVERHGEAGPRHLASGSCQHPVHAILQAARVLHATGLAAPAPPGVPWSADPGVLVEAQLPSGEIALGPLTPRGDGWACALRFDRHEAEARGVGPVDALVNAARWAARRVLWLPEWGPSARRVSRRSEALGSTVRPGGPPDEPAARQLERAQLCGRAWEGEVSLGAPRPTRGAWAVALRAPGWRRAREVFAAEAVDALGLAGALLDRAWADPALVRSGGPVPFAAEAAPAAVDVPADAVVVADTLGRQVLAPWPAGPPGWWASATRLPGAPWRVELVFGGPVDALVASARRAAIQGTP